MSSPASRRGFLSGLFSALFLWWQAWASARTPAAPPAPSLEGQRAKSPSAPANGWPTTTMTYSTYAGGPTHSTTYAGGPTHPTTHVLGATHATTYAYDCKPCGVSGAKPREEPLTPVAPDARPRPPAVLAARRPGDCVGA